MKIGLNSPTAFYALGVLFGVFSIIYFGMEVILEISPTVKSAILLISSITFFSATGLTESSWKNIPLYFLASASYLIFVLYTLARFDFGTAETFLILAGSSSIFLAAGYIVGEKNIEIPKKKSKYMVLAGIVLMVGIFLFDVSGPQPEVDLQLRNQVDMTHGEETALGTVKVTNEFILPRSFEVPGYEACMNDSRRIISLYTERKGDTVMGGGTKELELKARFYNEISEGENMIQTEKTLTVKETEKCPETLGEREIAVYERNID